MTLTLKTALCPTLLLLTLASLLGCSAERTVLTIGEVTGAGANSFAEKHARDTPFELDVAGPVAIDVESFSGDVTIEADPKFESARLTFTRHASHGFRRGDEAKASLEEIDYSVDLVPGKVGDVLQIRATTRHIEPHFQRVDIKIEIAEVKDVRIRTRNGDVMIRNIEGVVDIVNTDGHVHLSTRRPMTEAVTIINNGGDIDYRVRGEATGMFDCETVRGRVIQHVRYGRVIVHSGTDHDTLRATLNGGTNPIVLRAADGDIRVAVVANPTLRARTTMY